MLDTALELYNKILNVYKTQYYKLTKAQKKRKKVRNMPKNLSINIYFDEDEEDLSPIPLIKGNEEVKLQPEETVDERVKLNVGKRKNEETGLKMLTPNKLLTRLTILLAQI